MSSYAAPRESLTTEQQERLAELMDTYFVALEQGRPLGREQLVATHPDLAEPLAEFLDSLDFLHHAAAGFRARPEPFASEDDRAQGGGEIGDFKIIREIGRGGMGVVYEARQISLNRRVALKMLPFAALLDAKKIARFRNEAQAAAQLHHPHIVPVHFVGSDCGVHYYAMQFIDGQPLDRAIESLRRDRTQPRDGFPANTIAGNSGRKVSRVTRHVPGQDDARARSECPDTSSLAEQYSNSRSEYFRTVALLGVQAAEALHSAHEIGIVHRDVKPSNLLLETDGKLWVADFGLARFRSDANLTRSGDFVGTIRYMSPEQASGEPHRVDYRTDIYSLGVTLYELLALKHPVRAQDPAAILLHLASENPYRLRLWNARIPVDLENIVQKAMAKSRDERYATAQEMADDLRRFLDGKPTIAKRPTLTERSTKWVRRHKAVATFVVVLMAAVVGLLTSMGMLVRQQREKEHALAEAEKSFHQYRAQLALSSNHLALLHDQNGDTQAAEVAFQKAIRLFREILQEQPDQPETLRNLAASLNNLSFFYAKHDLAEVAPCYEETLGIQQRLVAGRPENPRYGDDLALTYSNFGSFHAQRGRRQQALVAYRKAIDILERLQAASRKGRRAKDLAIAYNNLGMTQDSLGQASASEGSFRKALDVLRSSPTHDPATPLDLSRRGGIHHNLGTALERQERWHEAVAVYAQAIDDQSEAAERAPQVDRFRDLLKKHRDHHLRVAKKLGPG